MSNVSGVKAVALQAIGDVRGPRIAGSAQHAPPCVISWPTERQYRPAGVGRFGTLVLWWAESRWMVAKRMKLAVVIRSIRRRLVAAKN